MKTSRLGQYHVSTYVCECSLLSENVCVPALMTVLVGTSVAPFLQHYGSILPGPTLPQGFHLAS